MIPTHIVDFVKGPLAWTMGTCSRDLQPCSQYTAGATLHEDGTMTVYLVKASSEDMFANLAENGKIALSSGHPLTHEGYQFKGSCIETREMSEEEKAISKAYVQSFYEVLSQFGIGHLAQILGTFECKAVTFKVEEIFFQTPGPEAGKKIYSIHETINA